MNDTHPDELRAELALLMAESERLHAAMEGISLRVAEIARCLAAHRASVQSNEMPHQLVATWRRAA